LGLVPDTAIIEENLAFLEGALKYGQYNWRIAGVRASTYNRALRRHLKRWWNGQDRDKVTQVMELASIRACAGIMIDAIACGMFTDDRPPKCDIDPVLERAAAVAKHLKELFKDHNPPQYTELEHGTRPGVPAQMVADERLVYPASEHVPAGTKKGPCRKELARQSRGMKLWPSRRRAASGAPRPPRSTSVRASSHNRGALTITWPPVHTGGHVSPFPSNRP
jgi:hypothetical protein